MRPILFHLGPLPVRSYGTLIMIGFLLALRYVIVQAHRLYGSPTADRAGQGKAITADHILDMSLIGLALGIVGTRVVFVVLHWEMFRDNVWEAFKIWTGGLSFVGGPLFGFAYAWWYCRRHRLSFAAVADLAAPGFALAYVFGRIGCFLNGCCYGHACALPWAVRFEADGMGSVLTPPSHPTQIYAAIMNVGIFVFLHRMLRRPHQDGQVILAYGMLYAAYRFINDFFRAGATSRFVVGWVTDGQLAALVAIPILFLLWRRLSSQVRQTS